MAEAGDNIRRRCRRCPRLAAFLDESPDGRYPAITALRSRRSGARRRVC